MTELNEKWERVLLNTLGETSMCGADVEIVRSLLMRAITNTRMDCARWVAYTGTDNDELVRDLISGDLSAADGDRDVDKDITRALTSTPPALEKLLHEHGKYCPSCGSGQITSRNSEPMHTCLSCKQVFEDKDAIIGNANIPREILKKAIIEYLDSRPDDEQGTAREWREFEPIRRKLETILGVEEGRWG